MIIGVDPGTTETAYAIVHPNYSVQSANKLPNREFLHFLNEALQFCGADLQTIDHVACESIQSYGMAVGREVFETAYMIGRIQQVAAYTDIDCTLYPRPEYAKAICGVSKINDSVLRQSLMLRFGGDKKGEACHLLKGCSDKRSAYAVAVYHLDKRGITR